MKLALAALLIAASAMPADAKPGRYSSRPGYAEEEKCFKNEYREEYIPGTSKRPVSYTHLTLPTMFEV